MDNILARAGIVKSLLVLASPPMATVTEISAAVRLGVFLARLVPWKRAVPTISAKLFGAIYLRVETQRKDFYADAKVVYTMSQAWLANGTNVDVHDARTMLYWRRRGGTEFDGWRVYGIWCKKKASGLASYPEGVEEQTELPSNGDTRHLGLVVKSAGSGEAYLVCTATYHAGAAYPNYQHPDYKLTAGIYDVDVEVTGKGGKAGLVRLEVHYGGAGAEIIALER